MVRHPSLSPISLTLPRAASLTAPLGSIEAASEAEICFASPWCGVDRRNRIEEEDMTTPGTIIPPMDGPRIPLSPFSEEPSPSPLDPAEAPGAGLLWASNHAARSVLVRQQYRHWR
eukprot:1795412-Rhodomonas_salina.1